MQNKQLTPDTIRAQKVSNLFYSQGNSSREKVDVNVLLNRVKNNQKNESRKKLYFSAAASTCLILFGIVIF